MELKMVRIAKTFGEWYYRKQTPNYNNDLDGPIWELYDSNQEFVADFAYYNDMLYYIRTGNII